MRRIAAAALSLSLIALMRGGCAAAVQAFAVAGQTIPIYPGALKVEPAKREEATAGDVIGACLNVVSYRTADNFAKVHAFYRSVMPVGTEAHVKGGAQGFIARFLVPTVHRGVTIDVMIIGPPPGLPPGAPHDTSIGIFRNPPEAQRDPAMQRACALIMKNAFPAQPPR